jgi:hypothetical protein
VIGTVLDFNPVDDCPLWLALINDVTDKSWVNLYNQWLWLTPDDILALQYRPKLSKQKIVPLSRGYHTHVTRFKAMYSELQCTPGWTDLDIFKITYDEYMAFSRQYMAGKITSNPLSPAPNSYASSTDLVTLFTKSIKQEPKDFFHINATCTSIGTPFPRTEVLYWYLTNLTLNHNSSAPLNQKSMPQQQVQYQNGSSRLVEPSMTFKMSFTARVSQFTFPLTAGHLFLTPVREDSPRRPQRWCRSCTVSKWIKVCSSSSR